jgi:hypothetical protein
MDINILLARVVLHERMAGQRGERTASLLSLSTRKVTYRLGKRRSWESGNPSSEKESLAHCFPIRNELFLDQKQIISISETNYFYFRNK